MSRGSPRLLYLIVVAYNSSLRAELGDGIIMGSSSPGQLTLTLECLADGPLEKAVADRIDEIWDSVKDEAVLDNFNMELKYVDCHRHVLLIYCIRRYSSSSVMVSTLYVILATGSRSEVFILTKTQSKLERISMVKMSCSIYPYAKTLPSIWIYDKG